MSVSFQSENLIILFPVLLFFLFWTHLLYRRTEVPLGRGTRALLIVLRSLALLAVILALLQPLFTFTEEVTKPPEIAVLLDTSASMNFRDLPETRLMAARQVLGELGSARLPKDAKLSHWSFSDSLRELRTDLDSLSAGGRRTAMGEALSQLRERRPEGNLSAALIVSDGGSNSGVDPLTAIGRLGVPVYAVGIGDPRPPLDVALGEVNFPEVAYSEIPARVELTVKVTSSTQRRIPVFLKSEGKLLGRADLRFDQAGEQRAEIEFIPQETGSRFFQLSIPPGEGERFTKNNYRSFSVEVLKSKLKILLVSSRPGWEFGFLKRVLEENPKLEVKPVVYGADGTFLTGTFPATTEALGEYEILVYIDPTYRQLQGKEGILKEYLQAGHSVLLLLGEDFCKTRAYSALGDVLPLDFPTGAEVEKGSYSPSLTPDGLAHPVTRLSENDRENRDMWGEVPPFEYIVPGRLVTTTSSSPGDRAVALLTCLMETKPRRELPAAVLSERHGGKVMAVTVFPLWRWEFLPHGFGGETESYGSFLANAVRWLATPVGTERVNVYSDRKVYSYGEKISILGKFYDQSFQPLEGVETRIVVSPEGETGSEAVEPLVLNLVEREPGRYEVLVPSLASGRYTLTAEATWRGDELGTFGGRFEVEEFALEEQELAADFELLRRLGELSGGGFYAPDEIDSLLGRLDFESRVVTLKSEKQLWHEPWLLALAVLCLALEWTIRKRNQLS
jgi:hypothetical protein